MTKQLACVFLIVGFAFNSMEDLLGQENDFKCRFQDPITLINGDLADAFFAGDIDGDFDVDLIVGHRTQPKLSILCNVGDAIFEIKSIDLEGGVLPLDLFDIDGDHDLDLLVQESTTTIRVLNNDGKGNFSEGQTVEINDIQIYLVILACNHADFDMDGDFDFVISGFGEGASGWMAVFENELGLLQPNDGAMYPNSVGGSLSVTDFDSDLDLDLLTAGPYGHPPSVVSFLINNGTGALDDTFVLSATDLPSLAVVADLNGDSTDDVAVATGWAQVEVSFNDGRGMFSNPTIYPIADAQYLSAGDIDADNDIDLVANSPSEDLITVMTNDGNGNFVPGQTTNAETPESSSLIDLDGDLDLDLVVRTQAKDLGYGIAVLLNECGLLGDVDQNGLVNLLDVDPFIQRLVVGEYQLEADMNCDDEVNLLDVSLFVDALVGN